MARGRRRRRGCAVWLPMAVAAEAPSAADPLPTRTPRALTAHAHRCSQRTSRLCTLVRASTLRVLASTDGMERHLSLRHGRSCGCRRSSGSPGARPPARWQLHTASPRVRGFEPLRAPSCTSSASSARGRARASACGLQEGYPPERRPNQTQKAHATWPKEGQDMLLCSQQPPAARWRPTSCRDVGSQIIVIHVMRKRHKTA